MTYTNQALYVNSLVSIMMIVTQQRLASGSVSPHVKLSYRKTDPSYTRRGGLLIGREDRCSIDGMGTQTFQDYCNKSLTLYKYKVNSLC